MTSKQYKSQKDTASKSLRITDDIKRQYEVKYGNTDIVWGDYWRDEDQRSNDREAGFISELVIADMFERLLSDDQVSHNGQPGEADIVLFGSLKVEVKARQSDTEYRNLVINDDHEQSKQSDIIVHTVVHRDIFSTEPLSVEVLGWIKTQDALDVGVPCSFYNNNNSQEGSKIEIHPHHLEDIDDITQIIQLFS